MFDHFLRHAERVGVFGHPGLSGKGSTAVVEVAASRVTLSTGAASILDRTEGTGDNYLIVYATVGAGGDDLARNIARIIVDGVGRSATDDNRGRLLLLLVGVGSIVVNGSRNIIVDNGRWLLLLLRWLHLGKFEMKENINEKIVSLHRVSRIRHDIYNDTTMQQQYLTHPVDTCTGHRIASDHVASGGTGRGVVGIARLGRSQSHRRRIPSLRPHGGIVEGSAYIPVSMFLSFFCLALFLILSPPPPFLSPFLSLASLSSLGV